MPLGSTVDVFATDDPNAAETAEQELQVYEKKDNILYGHRKKKEKVVTMEFIKKYIHVAKLVKPVLTQEASDHISEQYARLRSHDQVNSDSARTMPVTARALETMIRLATAHAKARMSKSTDLPDAEAALELMQFAYFKKILEKEKKKAPEDSMEVEGSQSQDLDSQRTTRKSSRLSKDDADVAEAGDDPFVFSEDEPETEPSQKAKPPPPLRQSQRKAESGKDRLREFKAVLLQAFKGTRSQSIPVPELLAHVNRGQADPFEEREVERLLGRMQDDNQVMVSEDVVFLI